MANITNGMTNEAILAELGARLRQHRLRLNLSQEEAAIRAAVAAGTIKNLEKGIGTLGSFVGVLRALNELEQLDNFLVEQTVSPIMMLKMRKPRMRARARNE